MTFMGVALKCKFKTSIYDLLPLLLEPPCGPYNLKLSRVSVPESAQPLRQQSVFKSLEKFIWLLGNMNYERAVVPGTANLQIAAVYPRFWLRDFRKRMSR